MKTLLRVTWPYALAFAFGVGVSFLYGNNPASAIVAGLLCVGMAFILLWAARQ